MLKIKFSTKALTQTAIAVAVLAISGIFTVPVGHLNITLQWLAAMLASAAMGRRAAAAFGAYLFMGLCGLPVFSRGGGFHYILQPSFGYLLGMAAMLVLMGLIIPNKPLKIWHFLLATAGMYAVGIPYFLIINPKVPVAALLAYIPADLVKCVIAVLAANSLQKLRRI